MSTGTRQNAAIAVILLVLGGALLLTAAPFEVGTIRLAGISLLWWYGVVAAPVIAVAVAVAALAFRDDEGAGARPD